MEEQEALTPTQQLLIAKMGLIEELLDTLEKIALVDIEGEELDDSEVELQLEELLDTLVKIALAAIEGEELDDSEVELQLADGTVQTVAVSAENSLLILREIEKRYGKKFVEPYTLLTKINLSVRRIDSVN